MKRFFFVFVLFIFLFTYSYGILGTAGGPAPFLSMGTGARAVSLSGAFSSFYDDVTCSYWNPAAISFINNIGLSTMISFLTLDRSYNYIGAVFPTQFGTVGFGFINFSIGNIEGRTGDTEEFYLFSDTENAYIASYGYKIFKWISLGGNIKLIDIKLAGYGANGFSFDAGIFLMPFENFSAGIVFRDFFNGLYWSTGTKERILFTMRIGVMVELLQKMIKLSLEGEQIEAHDAIIKSGIEMVFFKMLFLRCGCSYGFYSQEFDWTLGTGIKINIYNILTHIDYAMLKEEFFTSFDINHKISLSVYF
ncbi:MAG: hypothetical protein N3E50_01635 [Candidatus Goldbacteria bacterium]|nr:hypothetical protein [Candidatus Goldiibacteriota bacterium]